MKAFKSMCDMFRRFHNIDEYPAFTDVGIAKLRKKEKFKSAIARRIEFQATVLSSPELSATAYRRIESRRLAGIVLLLQIAGPPTRLSRWHFISALHIFCHIVCVEEPTSKRRLGAPSVSRATMEVENDILKGTTIVGFLALAS